ELLRFGLVGRAVRAETGDLLEVGVRLRERTLGPHEAADILHDRDLLQRRAAGIAVYREGQRLAHPDVIEGRLLRVRADLVNANPRRLLDRERAAERAREGIALLRREATEFDRRLLAADRVHLGAGVGDDEGLISVEVGQLDAVLVLAEVV